MPINPSDILLTGRVAVVTGGGAGIGRGIAAVMVGFGASVAIWERDPEGCAAVAESIGALGIVADVRDAAQVDGALRRTTAELGPATILVNTPAIHSSPRCWTPAKTVGMHSTRPTCVMCCCAPSEWRGSWLPPDCPAASST